MDQFVALIVPLGGGAPDVPPSGGHPSHPIYYPGGGPGFSPPGYWGGGPHPMPPIPPGGTYPPSGGAGAPVDPAYGIPESGRLFPSHPIYYPGGGPGFSPPGYWGGGPHPAPPINVPENPPTGEPVPVDPGYFPPGVAVPVPPEGGGPPTKAYVVAYVPGQGRITFLVDLTPPEPPTEATPK